MESLRDPRSIPKAAPPVRETALPASSRDIGTWMWRILNGGKVPSGVEKGEELRQLSSTLRSGNGNIPALARQYAEKLGWTIVRGNGGR